MGYLVYKTNSGIAPLHHHRIPQNTEQCEGSCFIIPLLLVPPQIRNSKQTRRLPSRRKKISVLCQKLILSHMHVHLFLNSLEKIYIPG